MTRYQLKLESGRIVTIADTDPMKASVRAADLHQEAVVAWRIDPTPQIHVGATGLRWPDGTPA